MSKEHVTKSFIIVLEVYSLFFIFLFFFIKKKLLQFNSTVDLEQLSSSSISISISIYLFNNSVFVSD